MMTKRTEKTMTTANGLTTTTMINKTHREQGKHSPATPVVKRILTRFESEVRTVMRGAFRRIHKTLNFKHATRIGSLLRVDPTCNFSISAVALMAVLAIVMVFGAIGAAEAAAVNYYVQSDSGTNVATGIATDTGGCADPTGAYTELLSTNINDMCTASYRWRQSSTGLHSEHYFNTAYSQDTTVTGVSYQVTIRDGGTVGFQLFYVTSGGSKTLFGNEVTQANSDGSTNNYVIDLSGQSMTVPVGAKLGLRTWGVATNPDFRVYLGNPDGRTGNISGHLIVDETVAASCTANAPTVNISTAPQTITTDGGSAVYNFTVTNTDSGAACSDVTFNLGVSDTNSTNFVTPSSLSNGSVTLAAGATSSTMTMTVSALMGHTSGTNTSTITASEAGHSNGTDNVVTDINIACDVSTAPAVSVDSVTNNSATISWTTVPNAVSYKVYRGATDLGTQTSPFTDTGRTANTSYNYTVVGVGSSPAGCEGPGGNAGATTLPDAAGAPTYTGVGTTSLTVNWTASSGGADSYDVYRGGVLQGNNAGTSYPDSGLSINTQYSYYVIARNASGDAAASGTTSVYTLAATPTVPTVGNPSGTTLDVTLGADTNPAGTVYAIRINGGAFTNQYVQVDGSVGAAETWLSSAAWTTTTVTGLAQNTTYSFDVKARNGDAVETAFGGVGQGTTLALDPTTTAGTATATPDDSSINVIAPYIGDDNGDNAVTVSWGLTGVDCSLGSQVLPHSASPYTYTITGLTNMTAYQVCVDYSDADGVNGQASQTITNVIPSNPMLHNSTNTGSTYWGGDWGVTASSKYGKISCETCHEFRATNIKGIKSIITAPNSPTDDFPGSGVTFTDARDGTGDFGDDTGGHATSQKICEACHSLTLYHNYDTTGQADLTHNNQTDCTSCHKHNTGFKPSACDSCHGDPPIEDVLNASSTGGNTGLADNPVTTGSATAGAHNTHVNILGLTCNNCHNGYSMPNSGDIDISFSAFTTTSGAYDGQIGVSYNGLTNGTGAKSCSSVYCHGGTIGGTAPVWDGTVACGDCHEAVSPALGSHTQHAGTLNLACDNCHGTGAGATAAHVNGDVAWDVTVLSGAAPAYKGAASGGAGLAPGTYGSCSSVYCHSDVQADGGNAGPTIYATTPIWGAGSVACGNCHAASPATGSHGKHLGAGDVSAPNAACTDCHSNGGQSVVANHGNELLNIDNSYSQGAASVPGTGGYGNCSNAACHTTVQSDGGGAGTVVTTPDWGTATACGECHSATPGTGSHTEHLNVSAAMGGASATCSDCHTAETVTTHLDNNIDVLNGYPTTNPIGNGYSTCNSASCHTNVQNNGGTGETLQTSPTWGLATACGECHNYTDGAGAAPLTTGTHSKHLDGAGAVCGDCHDGAGSGSPLLPPNHRDNNIDVSGGSTQIGSYSQVPNTPGNGYGSCNSIVCHGGNNATWGGGALGCDSCHSGAGDVDDYVYNNGTTARIDSTEWTTSGHGRSGGTYPVSGNSAANLGCAYCHDDTVAHGSGTNPFRLANNNVNGNGWNDTCLVCHATGSGGYNPGAGNRNATVKIDKYHSGAKHGGANDGGSLCFDCHDPHGDSNIIMVHADATKDKSDAYGTPGSTGSPVFTNNATGTDFARSSAPFDGICNVCHTGTNHYTSTSGDGHNSASVCTTCHTHGSDGVTDGLAFAPSGNCNECHAVQQGPRRPVINEFVGTSVATNKGHLAYDVTTANNATLESDCSQCHTEPIANHMDGTLNSPFATFNDPAYCLNCHNNGVSAPFSDGQTPADINSAWTGSFNHNKTNGCYACHGDGQGNNRVHGGQHAKLLRAATQYDICVDCHANGDFGTNISLEFATTNNAYHPVLGTLSGGSSSNLQSAQLTGGWTPGSTMTCTDCHNANVGGAKGPHGSSVKWILAGTNKAWPYTSASSNGATSGTFFTLNNRTSNNGSTNGLFCLNCHPGTNANNVHSEGDHSGYACVRCHIRVPHGGKVSRLITDANSSSLPPRLYPDGNGGSFTGVTSYTKASSPNGYNKMNCTTSCGGHGMMGGGENW